jgi:tetratricopeptide (TPR) repeat protein
MRALLIVALVSALAPASVARAGDKRAAAQHFRAGSALYERGEYVQALEEFDAGLAASPMPAFHVNLGQCYRKLERFDDAALEFTRFLDSGAGDPKLREEVAEALAEVRADAARRRDDEQRKLTSVEPPRAEPAARAERGDTEADDEAPRAQPGRALADPAPARDTATLFATPPPKPATAKKSRWWVWTLVGVAATGVVAAGVGVGVAVSQPSGPRAGSLGLLDGRR